MKKQRMREISMEVTVGAFMFMVLLVLGSLTIMLSRENLLAKSYPLEVIFERVQGLREGDNVQTRGVKVGRIKDVSMCDAGVKVSIRLDVPVALHEDYKVDIVPSSILGGQHLSIDAGSLDAPLLPEDAMIKGTPPLDLVKEASQTIHALRETLIDDGVLDDLKSAMSHVNEVTAKLEKGEGTVGKLLADEAVYNDLRDVAANLKEVSDRLADGEGMLGKLMAKDDTLYNDMADIASNLKEVSQRLADGKGTLGKLLSEDDALYEEAKLLLQEIRATVDDIRETAPITTFTSIFFGAF